MPKGHYINTRTRYHNSVHEQQVDKARGLYKECQQQLLQGETHTLAGL